MLGVAVGRDCRGVAWGNDARIKVVAIRTRLMSFRNSLNHVTAAGVRTCALSPAIVVANAVGRRNVSRNVRALSLLLSTKCRQSGTE